MGMAVEQSERRKRQLWADRYQPDFKREDSRPRGVDKQSSDDSDVHCKRNTASLKTSLVCF